MTPVTPDLPRTEIAIVELTNAFRKEHKLAPVTPNLRLKSAAQAYAEFLAKSNLFSHTADGRQPSDRIREAGYTFCQVAENLSLNLDSRGFETGQLAREAVEGWKASPDHRRNMLTPFVTEIGIGIAKSRTEEKYLSVQLFGRPDSLKYTFRISNLSSLPVTYQHGEQQHQLKPRVTVRHTTCIPAELVIRNAGDGPAAKAINARYQARDGDVFEVRSGANGGVAVELKRADAAAKP